MTVEKLIERLRGIHAAAQKKAEEEFPDTILAAKVAYMNTEISNIADDLENGKIDLTTANGKRITIKLLVDKYAYQLTYERGISLEEAYALVDKYLEEIIRREEKRRNINK
jgi:hypothetical protein